MAKEVNYTSRYVTATAGGNVDQLNCDLDLVTTFPIQINSILFAAQVENAVGTIGSIGSSIIEIQDSSGNAVGEIQLQFVNGTQFVFSIPVKDSGGYDFGDNPLKIPAGTTVRFRGKTLGQFALNDTVIGIFTIGYSRYDK